MKTNVRNIILNNLVESGKICRVDFVRKDGVVSTVHGRTGVHKYTKGGARTTSKGDYIMFYDFHKGYRNINRDTIVRVNGHNLKIEGGN